MFRWIKETGWCAGVGLLTAAKLVDSEKLIDLCCLICNYDASHQLFCTFQPTLDIDDFSKLIHVACFVSTAKLIDEREPH
jgi:hypothetical protein